MVKMVDLAERDTNLVTLVDMANSGTQVIVTKAGSPVARLVPIDGTTKTRVPDLHPGAFQPSENFDAPLPSEFWVGEA